MEQARAAAAAAGHLSTVLPGFAASLTPCQRNVAWPPRPEAAGTLPRLRDATTSMAWCASMASLAAESPTAAYWLERAARHLRTASGQLGTAWADAGFPGPAIWKPAVPQDGILRHWAVSGSPAGPGRAQAGPAEPTPPAKTQAGPNQALKEALRARTNAPAPGGTQARRAGKGTGGVRRSRPGRQP